jgi:hypothetical protein
MTRVRAVLVVWLVAGVAVAPARGQTPAAAASASDRDLAARAHFAAGRYAEALDGFAELYAETLHPTYLRNVGRCQQMLGEPDKAIISFREYLRKGAPLDAAARTEVEGFIAEMEALKKRRSEQTRRADTLPAAAPPAKAPAARPVIASLGELRRPAPTAEPAPASSRRWPWIVGGVLLVSAAAATFAFLQGRPGAGTASCPECTLPVTSVDTTR